MKKLITDAKAIGSLISEIGKSGKKLDKDIQLASVSIIAHVEAHGNVTLANRLITNMPKGSRVNAIISHLTVNGKMKWDDKAKKIVYSKTKKTDLQNAIDKPWWTEKPEAPFKPEVFDIAKILQGKFNKANDDSQREGLTAEQKTVIAKSISDIKNAAKALGVELVTA